jgi:hypothetical protein
LISPLTLISVFLSVGCSCNGDPSEQTTRGGPVLLR